VEAVCAVRAERLVLPLAALPFAEAGPPLRLRRGDPLTAEVQGEGFRVTAAVVAAGAGRAGDVQAKNSRSGSILRGQLGPDGRLRVAAAGNIR
jgi:flagella basal body P-ring formation protein FlgA